MLGFVTKGSSFRFELRSSSPLVRTLANSAISRASPRRQLAPVGGSHIPWGHVSSGCIYTGSKADDSGFTELDPLNFSFRTNNCSIYSGTKALGEECLSHSNSTYIWRLRIPFSNEDSPRNYISKLLRYDTLLDARNSISNLTEFPTRGALRLDKS